MTQVINNVYTPLPAEKQIPRVCFCGLYFSCDNDPALAYEEYLVASVADNEAYSNSKADEIEEYSSSGLFSKYLTKHTLVIDTIHIHVGNIYSG